MQAAVPNRTTFATRRVVKNGQIEAVGDDWSTAVATSQATYSASNARKLTNVTNVANIPVGALVQGTGVGREIYVRSKNVGAQEIELSAPLHDAEGTQNYTFLRFDYLLDFSGFASLSLFIMSDIEFQCNSKCSAVMLSPGGPVKEFQDCYFSRPKDRGITSIGDGCQGMLIHRCQFLSAEEPPAGSDRVSIRFHLHPEVDAQLDLGGAAVSIALKSGEIWVFRHDGMQELSLEPSVYLETGRLKPRASQQIRLSGRAMGYATRVRWSLSKAQETAMGIRDLNRDEPGEIYE